MLTFRYFQLDDFPEFQSWFADEKLNQELGPLDDEWLKAVMESEPLGEFVFLRGAEMVAVIGITYPDPDHREFFINSVAVKPQLQGQGIGRQAIDQLQKHFANQDDADAVKWVAFVDEENTEALAFFQKLGWTVADELDDNKMFRVETVFIPSQEI